MNQILIVTNPCSCFSFSLLLWITLCCCLRNTSQRSRTVTSVDTVWLLCRWCSFVCLFSLSLPITTWQQVLRKRNAKKFNQSKCYWSVPETSTHIVKSSYWGVLCIVLLASEAQDQTARSFLWKWHLAMTLQPSYREKFIVENAQRRISTHTLKRKWRRR